MVWGRSGLPICTSTTASSIPSPARVWAGALKVLGATDLDRVAAGRTAGAVLKYSEDLQAVRDSGFAAVAADEP